MKNNFKYILTVFIAFISFNIKAQFSLTTELDKISYTAPKEYKIGGITVSGTEHFDQNSIIVLSGLAVGQTVKVPGDKITKAIENLWTQKLFADVKIVATKVEGNNIFLEIKVLEQPRLSKFRFKGIKKSKQDDIRDEIKLIRGKVVTKSLIENTKNTVRKHFVDKGYYNAKVTITQEPDTTLDNNIILTINIDQGERVKIKDVNIYGNNSIKTGKLRRALKDTKRRRFYNIFTISKYIPSNYEKDKNFIIEKYNEKGYRDAKIYKDSVYKVSDKLMVVDIYIDEGNKYYFRNIKWIGNSVHTNDELSKILDIKKGDVYNKKTLSQRLEMNQSGMDVSSLYMDDGYLFFNIQPVEVKVENDSIDLEIRIYEGKQARIDRVTVVGNTKTNDHVILREIRTKPGQLFSRSDIIRTQRELSQLGYFNPETLGVNPEPDQENGTVDIEYVVEEKPSDQIELSGGWGAGRVVGTLGVSFNNFSTKNFFKKGAWRPLPAGDGQKLSVRAQSNGLWYQSYSMSFTEPWLGGRKPNSLSVSLFHSVQTNGQNKYITDETTGDKITNPSRQSIAIYGLSVGLGRRLKWPDDFFTLYNDVSYQYYVLNNYFSTFAFANGYANNLSFKTVLSRNSVDNPIYARSGSQTTLTVQFTPPYSLFKGPDADFSTMPAQEKYQFVEFHKWKFQTQWYTKLAGNLVLYSKAGYGFLGFYNKDLGQSPFERFYLGGDGLSGFALDGREIIALRGYGNGALSPSTGATNVAKYTMELRYPFSLNPSATIYGLTFVEAGNSWGTFNSFKPFEVKRSAGFGIRIFMPMFGILGLDWGYGFDDATGSDPTKKGRIHFSIGGNINGW
ncbi:MAG: POTRA domain-containing protein [Vicingaceae bacterium]